MGVLMVAMVMVAELAPVHATSALLDRGGGPDGGSGGC